METVFILLCVLSGLWSWVAFWSQFDKFSVCPWHTLARWTQWPDQLVSSSPRTLKPDRIHLHDPPSNALGSTPDNPHTPLINACLLQQVKPFQFEEGRNYVQEQCNYSGLQSASFRLKHKDSQKHLLMRISSQRGKHCSMFELSFVSRNVPSGEIKTDLNEAFNIALRELYNQNGERFRS